MTETVADGETFLEIEGRKIKAGISPQIATAIRQMIPLGRPGTPAEAAGAIYLLCTQEANYVSGQCLTVDAGMH
jgi:3-oxoacyl-[acyl-carrier protein] reductase